MRRRISRSSARAPNAPRRMSPSRNRAPRRREAMPASVQLPRRDRECRSGSRSPPGGGDGPAAHRGAEVLDEGRQGALHEPPSRDAGANRRARAVTGGRLQPPSAGGRGKEQGPRGRTLEGGTGKATVRGRAAAASPDAGAATGGRVRRYQNLGGRRTLGTRRLAPLRSMGRAAKENR